MAIKWKLKQFLDTWHITPYRLMQESGLSQGTIYRLVHGESVAVHADTLNAVLKTLSRLTATTLSITDLLEYVEDKDA